jgi:hypothetical protein
MELSWNRPTFLIEDSGFCMLIGRPVHRSTSGSVHGALKYEAISILFGDEWCGTAIWAKLQQCKQAETELRPLRAPKMRKGR